MNKLLFRVGPVALLGLIASTLISPAAFAAIYKWTDENGEVVYSQTPPPAGVQTEKVREAPPPPVDPEQAMDELRQRGQAFSERRGERLEVEEKGEEGAAQAKKQREICDQLRKNLETLETSTRIRVKGEDGEYTTAGEEVRQEKLQTTKSRLQKECSGS